MLAVDSFALLTSDATISATAYTLFTGIARTDSLGYKQIDLPEKSSGLKLTILTIMATPLQRGLLDDCPRPSYLVSKINGDSIALWSFAANGDWLPSVEFSWLCIARITEARLMEASI